MARFRKSHRGHRVKLKEVSNRNELNRRPIQFVTSADGTSIAFEQKGSGRPLIFVTGALCYLKFLLIRQDAKMLADTFTVITYDRPGRRESTDTAPWAVDREIEDLAAMIDAIGGKATIFGHSSDAVPGLEAALRGPEWIEQIFVYDPPLSPWVTDGRAYGHLADNFGTALDAGKAARAVRTFSRGIGIPLPIAFMMSMVPSVRLLALTLRCDIALTRMLPPTHRYAGITVPTTVIAGARSPADVRESACRIGDGIQSAPYQEIPGQDRMVSMKAIMPILTARITSPFATECLCGDSHPGGFVPAP